MYDVAEPDDVQRPYAASIEAFGQADILVNNAGIPSAPSLLEISAEEWDRVIAVNVRGPFLCSRAVLPA